MGKDKPKEKASLQSFLKVGGLVVVTLMSTFIGYALPKYLGSENIKVPNISIQEKELFINVPFEQLSQLEDYQSYSSTFIVQETIDIENVKALMLYLKKLRNILIVQKEAEQNRIRANELEDIINEKENEIYRIFQGSSSESKELVETLRSDVNKLQQEYDDLIEKSYINIDKEDIPKGINIHIINTEIKEIIQLIIEQSQDNIGNFQIEVVLFNSGEAQSVTQTRAQIEVEDIMINLKRKESIEFTIKDVQQKLLIEAISGNAGNKDFLEDFIIVEGESYNNVTLVLDEYNNEARVIDRAKRDYLNGTEMAKLHLFNIKNERFSSNLFYFRPSLNESKGESIVDFIKRNFYDILAQDSTLQLQLEQL